MDTVTDSAKQLHESLSQVYNLDYEYDLYTAVISEFYKMGTDSTVVERIITELYNLTKEHDVELADIIGFMDDVYCEEDKPNSGVKGIEKLITKQYNKSLALKTIRDLKTVLSPFDTATQYFLNISDDTSVVMNVERKEVIVETIKYNRKGQDTSEYTRVLSCYPSRIIVHNNPISDEGRKFTIEWVTKQSHTFKTEQMLVSDIESYLSEHAYVLSPRLFRGIVSCLIQIYLENELAELRYEIETPGIYYNQKKNTLDLVDYEIHDVDIDLLNKALDVIDELQGFFEGRENKLAITLKHGLVSAFGFAKKQMGLSLEYLVQYLFHSGKGGSGKTTVARMELYFWGKPELDINDVGGTEIDTVPRLGERVSRFTFPLIVNEPGAIFKYRKMSDAVKTMVERTNSRGKFEGNKYVHILSLSTLVFTSNPRLPVDEGLNRRFIELHYSLSDKKATSRKEAFVETFKLKNPSQCRFHLFKELSNFAVHEIMDDIELLRLPWLELANSLLLRAYADCGRECPSWLLEVNTSDFTSEDIDEEEIEDIRTFFIKELNYQSKQIKYFNYDDGSGQQSFMEDVKSASDFRERVYNIINERLIPYMELHHGKDDVTSVCFRASVIKPLNSFTESHFTLKGLGELLKWNYGSVNFGDNKRAKVLKVSFNEFLNFLYPQVEE